MAKPNPQTPATSLSSHYHPPRHSLTHSSSAASPRQANIQGTRPSKTVVALLAAVAASSSTADGRPLSSYSQPLDFLCPILASDPLDCPSSSKVKSSDSNVDGNSFHLSPSPARTKQRQSRSGSIPDKFSPGDDGIWRKVPNWTLYGSTQCPPTGVPEVDDQIDPTQISGLPTSLPTASTDMTTELPPGWDGTDGGKDIPPYILALSIFLAILICLTIFGCVGWRRKRRARSLKDYEKRLRKKVKDEHDTDSDMEELKSVRSHQKMWAKASAKWRAGVRVAARRRRRKPASLVASDPTARMSTDTIASSIAVTLSTSSRIVDEDIPFPADHITTSNAHSRHGDLPQDHHTAEESTEASRPSQPPQYPDGLTTSGQHSDNARPSLPDIHVTPAHSSMLPTATPSIDDTNIPYSASVGGHIATDDKAMLSRLAEFASFPPTESGASSASCPSGPHSVTGPSVPVLEDLEQSTMDLLVEQGAVQPPYAEGPSEWSRTAIPSSKLAETGVSSLSIHFPAPTYSRDPSPYSLSQLPPLVFPPPPSKAQLFYEYPSFEQEFEGTEPLPIPSAPPFDYAAGPSAPPGDVSQTIDVSAVACAPPLIDEEDEAQLGLNAAPSSFGQGWTASTDDENWSQFQAPSSPMPQDERVARCSCEAQTPHSCSCPLEGPSAPPISPDYDEITLSPPSLRRISSPTEHP